MTEAFVYLWYDAPNKMYYLGSHKGSPEDSYTHSSTIWESFTKDNIPEGVTRRILAYGTHEEMLALESKLQANRKERCWDRYYNDNVCDGVYGGFGLGENNPTWKGGISLGNNRKKYEKDKYAEDKELGMKLYNEGYSYDEIKLMHPKARLPYHLISQEEKDRRNAMGRERYENKRECYCRKSSCEYCSELLLTPEEIKRRKAESSKIRNEKDKLDPIKDAHKKEVSRIWEEKNKEKRRQQQRDRYVKKGPTDISGKKNPFYGKKHTPETRKKISEKAMGRTPWNKGKGMSRKKAEKQGVGTLDAFLK